MKVMDDLHILVIIKESILPIKVFFSEIISGIPDFNTFFFGSKVKNGFVIGDFGRKLSHFVIFTNRTVVYTNLTVIYTNRTDIYTNGAVIYTNQTLIFTVNIN